jgi:lipopolysaccharide transport system permease protein
VVAKAADLWGLRQEAELMIIKEGVLDGGVNPRFASPDGNSETRRQAVNLPQKPLVTIRPRQSWVALDLHNLWAYRELLYFLIWRDVKVRYKQTLLGVAWAILQPLVMIVIFTLIFGRVAGLPSDGIPYALFAYAGVVTWTFFSSAVAKSGNSLVGSAHLITKVYFPRMMIPAAAVCAAVVDLVLAFVVLVPLMLYYGVMPKWQIMAIFPVIGMLILLGFGVGMWMSALNVKYRDVGFVIPFVIQIWMFLSPVIYPSSALPPKFRIIMMFNPVSGIIEASRSALFGLPFNWLAILISGVITLLTLACAAFWFRRMEREFADVV